jgi:hypothetical protein
MITETTCVQEWIQNLDKELLISVMLLFLFHEVLFLSSYQLKLMLNSFQ